MTRNKNRKESVRQLATQEGVGVARATTIHDRERESVKNTVDSQIDAERLSLLIGSDYLSGKPVRVYFDPQVGQSPHYMIRRGPEKPQFNVLDNIRREIEASGIANFILFSDQATEMHYIRAAIRQYNSNLAVMANIGTDDFSELRKIIGEVGAPDYTYLFIYDYAYAVESLPEDIVRELEHIIEHGWKSGVRVIAAMGDEANLDRSVPTHPFMNNIFMEDEDTAAAIDVFGNGLTRIVTGFPFGEMTINSNMTNSESGNPYVIVRVEDYDGGGLGFIRVTKCGDNAYTTSLEEADSPEAEQLLSSVHAYNMLTDRLKKIAAQRLG